MLRRSSALLAAASLLAAGAGLFTVTGASAAPAAPGSHPAQSFTSIFADAASSFTGVGWAACGDAEVLGARAPTQIAAPTTGISTPGVTAMRRDARRPFTACLMVCPPIRRT